MKNQSTLRKIILGILLISANVHAFSCLNIFEKDKIAHNSKEESLKTNQTNSISVQKSLETNPNLYNRPVITEEKKRQLIQEYRNDGRPILIVTDSWHPQTNGVVVVYDELKRTFEEMGIPVKIISTKDFPHYTPTWKMFQGYSIPFITEEAIEGIYGPVNPQSIVVATPSGMLGRSFVNYFQKRNIKVSSVFHTRYADYVDAWTLGLLPFALIRDYFKAKFSKVSQIMVPTKSMVDYLLNQGYPRERLILWSHGVDTNMFHPSKRSDVFDGLKRPVQLFVGRVAKEKNIEAFLRTKVPGTKVIVGTGPLLKKLKRKYPDVVFLGRKVGEEKAAIYASSDVFVFPSRTDTFGLVNLEALSSGVPVAAFPEDAPKDILNSEIGTIDENLETAIRTALTKDPEACRKYAEENSWEVTAFEMLEYIKKYRLP